MSIIAMVQLSGSTDLNQGYLALERLVRVFQSVDTSVVGEKGIVRLVWDGLTHLSHSWLAISSRGRAGWVTWSLILLWWWQASKRSDTSRVS